jgi:hypothetical protein
MLMDVSLRKETNMNLRRVPTEDLLKELNARTVLGEKYDPLPVDTRFNHLTLKRDSQGRFVKA